MHSVANLLHVNIRPTMAMHFRVYCISKLRDIVQSLVGYYFESLNTWLFPDFFEYLKLDIFMHLRVNWLIHDVTVHLIHKNTTWGFTNFRVIISNKVYNLCIPVHPCGQARIEIPISRGIRTYKCHFSMQTLISMYKNLFPFLYM